MDYEFWEFIFSHIGEITYLLFILAMTSVLAMVLIGMIKMFFFD